MDLNDTEKTTHRENFVITRQKGSRIYGYITMEEEPDKRWEFEGNFSGRFLQLFYYPQRMQKTNCSLTTVVISLICSVMGLLLVTRWDLIGKRTQQMYPNIN
jgi:hypothetical protein